MRIDALNMPTAAQTRPASGGDSAERARLLAGFGEVFFASLQGEQAGPAEAAARRSQSDPLGLATADAMRSPGANATAGDGAPRAGAGDPRDTATAGQGETSRGERGHPRTQAAVPGDLLRPDGPRSGGRGGNGSDATPSAKRAGGEASPGGPAVAGPGVGLGVGAGSARSIAGRAGSAGVQAVGGVQASAGRASAGPPLQGLSAGAVPGAGQAPQRLARGEAASPEPAKSPILRGEQAEIAPQVEKGLATLLDRRGGRVQIQLTPHDLGRVNVDLTIRDGVVSARFEAENESARELLSRDADRLRGMLEHRGLRVEKIEIASDVTPREAADREDATTGHRRTPEEDGPGGSGRDAGDGSPGSGDGRHARGGAPGGRAERGGPSDAIERAEPGDAGQSDADEESMRRSRSVLSVRLDTVA